MNSLPDVQNYRSPHLYKLTRVGVTSVRKPVRVSRGGHANHLVGKFDAFVDLPAAQRGIHMSRTVEAVNEAIDAAVRETTVSLEALALRIARTLLARHDYAREAEVHVEGDYFRERRTPFNDAPTLEHYKLAAIATAARDEDAPDGVLARKAISVTAIGMSACPCAMEGTRHILRERGAQVDDIPTVTHNQRNHASILIETDPDADVEADDLIDIAENALSAPTFELLKRGDETALVMRAHENPKFVEDVVRGALAAIEKRYGHLEDDAIVVVRSEAEESIHKHNAVAERSTTMGELREPVEAS